MRIKNLELTRFKRFSRVKIGDIPQTTRLIIVAGPNGCGKSSMFEAMNAWVKLHRQQHSWDESYHIKEPADGPISFHDAINIEFHGGSPAAPDALRKAIYVRTAYRNDPEFQLGSINCVGSALSETRFSRMIDNDQAVGSNYQRLVAQSFEDVFENEAAETTIGDFREKAIGEISAATRRLFPDLIMNSLGNPLTTGTFKFDKGSTKGFLFKNLSGGEKAAFDLLLDMIVKRREFDDSVFCIDEPEAHMNTRLQGALLQELFNLTDDGCQLWLATHSVGMMRKARDLLKNHPGEVVFLDFGGRDFDQPQSIEPQEPTRLFWERVLDIAFDDMAALIAPAEIILCEGSPLGTGNKHDAIDAACYDTIFSREKPDARFISVGNSLSVEADRLAVMATLKGLIAGSRVWRLIDRDDLSQAEVSERAHSGVRVLERRNLESYLFDDEILTRLCVSSAQPQAVPDVLKIKCDAVVAAITRGRPEDDIKAAAGEIVNKTRVRLSLH